MDLTGKNIVVIDVETARSAEDCRHCGKRDTYHYADGACGPWHGATPADSITQFSALGWDNPPALGLSIGCTFDYQAMRLHWFDLSTLEEAMLDFVIREPLLVSFNGIGFDFPLMSGLLKQQADHTLDVGEACHRRTLANAFTGLCATSYDLLAEVWKIDPENKFARGLNSLDALSQANGLGAKEMDGAMAPRLWAQGRYAAVLNYCAGDVRKTRGLFELVCAGTPLLRGDGLPVWLPIPGLP